MTSEELFEEMTCSLKPYTQIIEDLESFGLDDTQVGNVLLLIYQYRFNNALKNTNVGVFGNGGW